MGAISHFAYRPFGRFQKGDYMMSLDLRDSLNFDGMPSSRRTTDLAGGPADITKHYLHHSLSSQCYLEVGMPLVPVK